MSHMWGWKGSINSTEVQFLEGEAREERKEIKEGNGRKKERKKEEKREGGKRKVYGLLPQIFRCSAD